MSTIILTSVIAGAAEVDRLPDYLDGVPMLEHDAGILQAGPLTVRYDYRVQDHIFVFPPRPGGLAFVAAETYRAALEAARQHDLVVRDCKPNLDLHIVQIEQGVFARPVFDSWRRLNGQNYRTLYGIYDPTPDVKGQSVIAFVDLSTNRVLAHEFGHYWYDRFCLYDADTVNTEAFARMVETLYGCPVCDV
jgi:hypothetical protein